MSLPQNMTPDPVPPKEDVVAEETVESPVTVEEEEISAEDSSDAQLRQWAKDNGIEGVPASGRLSASWREQITSAMADALDPKEEASAETTSSDSSILLSEKEETKTSPDGEETSPSTEDLDDEPEAPVAPEFETGEYRSVFKAPNTFMSSQAFTA